MLVRGKVSKIQPQKNMKCQCNWDIWGLPVSEAEIKTVRVEEAAHLGDSRPLEWPLAWSWFTSDSDHDQEV